jgi:hypothetical protein
MGESIDVLEQLDSPFVTLNLAFARHVTIKVCRPE